MGLILRAAKYHTIKELRDVMHCETPQFSIIHPMKRDVFLFQSFEKLYQARALAGAWSSVHIEVTVGVVDGEEGDTLYVECLTQSSLRVPQLMTMHMLLIHLLLPYIFCSIDGDRNEDDVLVLEGLLKLLEYGDLTQAGHTPACPHVNVYVLATEGAEVYYVALTVLEYDALGEGLSGYGGAVLGKVDCVLRAEAIALGGLL